MTEHATCRSCGAPIRWVRTARGRAMPLDPEPHPEGTIDVDRDGLAVTLSRAMRGAISGRPLYRSHFATCPAAAAHRRRHPPGAGTTSPSGDAHDH